MRRESFLGVYGPLSLLFLLALWAAGLVLGFGALHWCLGATVQPPDEPPSPVLYNAFSRREVSITLLDPRAGSPPAVDELLSRHGRDHLRRAYEPYVKALADHLLMPLPAWISATTRTHDDAQASGPA